MKIQMLTQPRAGTSKELTPLYAESINMLHGLAYDEIDRYMEEHMKIIDVTPYVTHREDEINKSDQEAIWDLRQA